MAYKDFRDKVLNDPATHDWVKDVIRAADKQNNVADVLYSLQFLQRLFNYKWEDELKRVNEMINEQVAQGLYRE
jgi:hypothetical protein